MQYDLTDRQLEQQASIRRFVDDEIAPHAAEYDRQGQLPAELFGKLARHGYFGALIPQAYGGLGWDKITYGLLCQELGRVCPAVGLLINVQSMVASAILRWGSSSQRDHWVGKLAQGEVIAAFALTEPEVGSDARNVRTGVVGTSEGYLLDGRKKWISFAQVADLFLVLVQYEGKPCALIVEKETPGLSVAPISEMLGLRAVMLGALQFDGCRVSKANLVGGVGFGFSPLAVSALDLGRYSVAWICVGLAQACLEASLDFAAERVQFGERLKEHQLIQRLITDMATNLEAARLLCCQAGYIAESGEPAAGMKTMMAKYFASRLVVKAARDAVQIHGALGCSAEYPVERYLRDANIMEIIEGTSQVHQISIAGQIFQSHER